MDRLKKRIISIIFTCLVGCAGFFFTKDYNFLANWGLVIIIVTLTFGILGIIIETQNDRIKTENEKNTELKDKNNRLQNEVDDLKRDIEHYKSGQTVSPGENIIGNNFLFMALTQHPAEPLKLSMLEKSVEHGNIIAALILANIYAHGIEQDGEIILKGNRDKAYEIYCKVCENDNYGVSDWIIGFYFQNNLIRDAQICDNQEKLEMAHRYFLSSEEKGFPKAKTSLGKLIHDSSLGFDPIKNEIEMIKYFESASTLGDYRANIYLGNIYLDRYNIDSQKVRLERAKEWFEKAAKMNIPEALIKLGIIYIEFYSLESEESYIKEAQINLELATSFVTTQFTAAGYFLLGNLLKQHCDLIDINSITRTLKYNRFNDLIIECHVRAYEIFSNLKSKGKTINDENLRYFNLLSQSFKNIDINPLQFQLNAKATNSKKNSGALPK